MQKSVRSSLNRSSADRFISNGMSNKSRIKLSVLDQRGILLKNLASSISVQLMDMISSKLIEALMQQMRGRRTDYRSRYYDKRQRLSSWSEKFPRKFHGVGPFSIDDGNLLSSNNSSSEVSFSEAYG